MVLCVSALKRAQTLFLLYYVLPSCALTPRTYICYLPCCILLLSALTARPIRINSPSPSLSVIVSIFFFFNPVNFVLVCWLNPPSLYQERWKHVTNKTKIAMRDITHKDSKISVMQTLRFGFHVWLRRCWIMLHDCRKIYICLVLPADVENNELPICITTSCTLYLMSWNFPNQEVFSYLSRRSLRFTVHQH